MRFTRREFIEVLVAASITALFVSNDILEVELYKLLGNNKTTYIKNKPVNETEIVTITVTETESNSQAPQTYTETVTQTVTEYSNTTTTQSPTQTSSTTTQPPQTLEQILFGNSNMQFIPLEVRDAEIGTYNAHITVYDYVTNTQLTIELPIRYVSNGNINIRDLLSAVKKYKEKYGTEYRVYLVLGRTNVNQAIQQNGQWILPASAIYYNIVISDKGPQDVYNALQNLLNGNATVLMPTSSKGPYSNSLYGWSNAIRNNIIIDYQNGQQVNSVINYINLADYILETPNNPNPTNGGILHVDTIANAQQVGTYTSGGNQYSVYGVNNYYITLIDFQTEQGTPLISNL